MYVKEVAKSKTAAKILTYKEDDLQSKVLNTLRIASTLVGSTLGPNGKVVLIERQENLPPMVSKDGITVFNSIAFQDSTSQAILEVARDSSARTNAEAGDNTTTATILAASMVEKGFELLKRNHKLSAQKLMRDLEGVFSNVVEPFIASQAIKITNENSDDLIKKVAMIATNSDENMSNAVVEAFSLVGHNGQMTINEVDGSGGYEVEKIEGLPISRGLEDSCGRFLEEFINDKSRYRTILLKPHFVLFNGKINDIGGILPLLQEIAERSVNMENPEESVSPNVVVMAHGFSDIVLAFMAQNTKNPSSINILPVKTPVNQLANSPYHFLCDVAAYTGAKIFDPLTAPLATAEIKDCGTAAIEQFESYRYRSSIIGQPDEVLVIDRAEELNNLAKSAASILDRELMIERAALLVGGIAKINVKGSSEAELKEKRHRVEDAIMAIKGALKHGVLPGCGKTLLYLRDVIADDPSVSEEAKELFVSAFNAPFNRIFTNGGYSPEEIKDIANKMVGVNVPFMNSYNVLTNKYGHGVDIGVVDSAAAVLMSVKNSLSVAKMLMTLSGTIVFKRDGEMETHEAQSYHTEQEEIKRAERESELEKYEDLIGG